ncbi:MAG: signal recognition particle protein [Candidatus Thermoplasmatota archaeon]|nr:signal recognition particle protein [Candidatus Thermoplasmatota archaeon]
MAKFLDLFSEQKNPYQYYNRGKVNAVLYYFSAIHLIKKDDNTMCLTEQGERFLKRCKEFNKDHALFFIKNLIDADVCWIKVKTINRVASPEFVYDLTVEDNHSFCADGIIVHNTTSCGKLATYFKRKGLRPVLIAGDVHRPAAFEQLKQISEQVEVPFYGDKSEKNAVRVIKEGLDKFKRVADVIIVDTSGRHKLEDELISEMKDIFKAIKPDEKLLVMDAAMGQQAGPQAKAFNDAIGITGIVLTKLDGTAKGGGALSAASEVGAPIVFVGTGEHSADFEKFDPSGFISRLLGMGDLKSLLERAEESMQGKDAEKTARKLMSGKFNLNDMYEQMNMISGMGPLSKIAEMLPGGMSGKLKKVDMDETQDKLKKFRIIMDSMTHEERENPECIQASRIRRIAKGAGVEHKDVKEVLKYYNMTKRMMKGFSSDRKMRRNLMRQLDFGK